MRKNLLSENNVIIQAELLDYDRQAIIDLLQSFGYHLVHEIKEDGYFQKKA